MDENGGRETAGRLGPMRVQALIGMRAIRNVELDAGSGCRQKQKKHKSTTEGKGLEHISVRQGHKHSNHGLVLAGKTIVAAGLAIGKDGLT
jgi:hypothetical protein